MDTNKQILKLLDSRIFFLSAKFFELVEKNFPDVISTNAWKTVRDGVLDLTNDIIRANHEDLSDYDIHYMPIRIVDNNDEIKYRFSTDAVKVFKYAVFDVDSASLTLFSPSYRVLYGICRCLNLDNIKIDKTQNNLYITKLNTVQCKNNLHILSQVSFSKENYTLFKQWCHIIKSFKCEDRCNAK